MKKLEDASNQQLRGWRVVSNIGIGKIRIPEIFNLLGVLLSNIDILFLKFSSLYLFKIAIFLNPYQQVFQTNFISVSNWMVKYLQSLSAPEVLSHKATVSSLKNYIKLIIKLAFFFIPIRKRDRAKRKLVLESLLEILTQSSFQNNPNHIELPEHYVPVMGIDAWCVKRSYTLHKLSEKQEIFLTKPSFVNIELLEEPNLYEGKAILPDIYLGELKNMLLFGGTDLIFDPAAGVALYDEIAYSEPSRYDIKSKIIRDSKNKKICLNYIQNIEKIIIPEAIHFLKDHSLNYFHWIIECLPRLSTIVKFPELNSKPLIIDANLPPQCLQSLRFLNDGNYPIIMLPSRQACFVEKLYYPSSLSFIHDNHYSPVSYRDDMLYSPQGITYVRETLLEKIVGHEQIHPRRKIYIRRKGTYRHLLNAAEIENILKKAGFEIICPETLSFVDQVKLFAESEVVVGQGGAWVANLLFAQAGTKVIILINNDKINNYNMFHGWASQIGILINHILGESIESVHGMPGIHRNFKINTALLKNVIYDRSVSVSTFLTPASDFLISDV